MTDKRKISSTDQINTGGDHQPYFAFVSAFVLVARPRFSMSSSSRSAAAMASELIWCLRFCVFVARVVVVVWPVCVL